MEIGARKEANVLVITVGGRMDAVSAPDYEKWVKEWIGSGEMNLLIDLGHLDYISSAGLRAILVTSKDLKSRGGRQCFCSLQPAVREIFELSGFSAVMEIHEHHDAAMASMSDKTFDSLQSN